MGDKRISTPFLQWHEQNPKASVQEAWYAGRSHGVNITREIDEGVYLERADRILGTADRIMEDFDCPNSH